MNNTVNIFRFVYINTFFIPKLLKALHTNRQKPIKFRHKVHLLSAENSL